MIRKGKVIKRVYVKGRETIVPHAASSAKRQPVIKKETEKIPQSPIITPRPVIIDTYELPSNYDKCRITLMVKDPHWIFAYWELAPVKEAAAGAKIVLRMYDITMIDFNGSNANHYFDIEVGSANSWYINLWHDSVSYVAEIGLRFPDAGFIPFARSNYISTPRASYSQRSEQIWMKVTDEECARPYIRPAAASLHPAASAKVTAHASAGKGRKSLYLTEDEIRRYYARLSPLLRDIISVRLGRLYGRKYTGAFLLEGESAEERKRILSRYPHLKKLMLGASQELFLGASEQFGGASEFVHQRRKFFFQLAAELIVYGRTEPDAELFLGGKKIPLNQDGTFNLRFALPDGKIPLEFKAVSADKKESKSINTYVERNTNYHA